MHRFRSPLPRLHSRSHSLLLRRRRRLALNRQHHNPVECVTLSWKLYVTSMDITYVSTARCKLTAEQNVLIAFDLK